MAISYVSEYVNSYRFCTLRAAEMQEEGAPFTDAPFFLSADLNSRLASKEQSLAIGATAPPLLF
jgi:hypothetical protein